jgi:hypothetical protein
LPLKLLLLPNLLLSKFGAATALHFCAAAAAAAVTSAGAAPGVAVVEHSFGLGEQVGVVAHLAQLHQERLRGLGPERQR